MANDSPNPRKKIAIIGAGPGGLCMGIRLKAAGFEDPTRHPQVKAVLRGVKREIGTAQRQATPLGTKQLRALVSHLDPEKPRDVRDRALIMARTDAIAVEGIGPALDRAEAYLAAGADILFVEAPQDDAQIGAIMERFRGRVPLLANMVEGGRTPIRPVAELQQLGYSLAIFPGGAVRAMAATAQRYYANLVATGSNAGLANQMFDFGGLNQVIGTDEMLASGKRYEG